ncbi:carboxypeptidase S [Fistulina hepatica ATCC 64428]|uniref:Carboxypeptidase S n=1 Tax=Fistulina hepatica ATCC 64428 TaxID=1128425 RepID=A0A0D7AM49_9AGAR|nr:carboxypeptidase S [Fistulina hepatica ATCC 64428]
MRDKNTPLPTSSNPIKPPTGRSHAVAIALFSIFAIFSCIEFRRHVLPFPFFARRPGRLEEQCYQASASTPQLHSDLYHNLSTMMGTQKYRMNAVDGLSRAVQIPTESYDDMGPVGVDARWEVFGTFHDYLQRAFPTVHARMSLTHVNTYGLLFQLQGSNPSLKPLLLMAHQDVVPVEPRTVQQWKRPPYSGYYDGTYVWGRGSSDFKSGLIGIMMSLEALLNEGFQPTRTIILSFGFDEESRGQEGAGRLSRALLEKYGENSMAMIVDEGGGFVESYGSVFAAVSVAEKGYLDVRIEVNTPGGHSSVPPAHTAIGILSSLIVEYEKRPFPASLTRDDALYDTAQCYGKYGVSLPNYLRHIIRDSTWSDGALHQLRDILLNVPLYASILRTTQAVDMIEGGVKSNALPETAYAIMDHRISGHRQAFHTRCIQDLADDLSLSLNAFGHNVTDGFAGSIQLSSAFGEPLEPAPVTPTGRDAAPWNLLSGTIKETFNVHRSLTGNNNIIVAPAIMSGNTDTRFYWKLSPHIFRYSHDNGGDDVNNSGGLSSGIHTVNEDHFIEEICFYTTLILNADESIAL